MPERLQKLCGHYENDGFQTGTYTALGTGAPVGGVGAAITVGNSKGVIIDPFTTTQGAHPTVGRSNLTIEMKK
jgi:hypothetical protein